MATRDRAGDGSTRARTMVSARASSVFERRRERARREAWTSNARARRSGREATAGALALVVASAVCGMLGWKIGSKVYDALEARAGPLGMGVGVGGAGRALARRVTAEKTELSLERYPNARCLDGTPGVFYVNLAPERMKGSVNEGETRGGGDGEMDAADGYSTSRTWVVMLQGGGECVNAVDCSDRAGTARGSSELVADEMVYDKGIQAVTRDEEGMELPFVRANMATVAYCSGDAYMGRATQADEGGFWHSGAHIVEAVLSELVRSYGMGDADVIVLAGRSAGGIGLIAQVDKWASLIREKLETKARSTVKIMGAPFAGFHFFHNGTEIAADEKYIPWDSASFKRYIDFWRADESLPRACVQRHGNEPWSCAVAENSFTTIRTPLFFSQALTDSVVMHLHDNFSGDFSSSTAVQFALDWGQRMREHLAPVMNHNTAGLFAASCYMHTDFDNIVVGGMSHHKALAEWVFKNKRIKLVDDCVGLMCNPTCKNRGANAIDLDEVNVKRNEAAREGLIEALKAEHLEPETNASAPVGRAAAARA